MRVEFVAVEPHHLVAAGFLGDVQRVVSRPDYAIAVRHPGMRPPGDAEAARATNAAPVEDECMSLHFFAHPFREGHRGVQHGAWQQNDELLTTVPTDDIDLARGPLE